MTVWRFLPAEAADGPRNMAVDETLLEGGGEPPTLRLYRWSPAALSLGRSQPAAGSHDPSWLRARGIDLVRRPTGGRAVLHDVEVTYAVVGRTRTAEFPGGVEETYRRLAEGLIDGLRRLGIPAEAGGTGRDPGPHGPPSCFAVTAAHEITSRGRKLVGAAQTRRKGAFLQHGSIPIRSDPERIASALGSPVDPSAFTDLEREVGGPIGPEDVEEAIRRGFEARLGVDFRVDGLSAAEALRAEELRAWKYDSAAWTLGGKVGSREARLGPRTSL